MILAEGNGWGIDESKLIIPIWQQLFKNKKNVYTRQNVPLQPSVLFIFQLREQSDLGT